MRENHAAYFKHFRRSLGFESQQTAKDFLAAKDIPPAVDMEYIHRLNERIELLMRRMNSVLPETLRQDDIDRFCRERVRDVFGQIRNAGLIPRLNNQGRRPEEVLFSWLRGYASCALFIPAMSSVFGIPEGGLHQIGGDDFTSLETFKRSPRADLEFEYAGQTIRLEMQSGYQGINDIKEHKVREARRAADDAGIRTICAHFDFFNGQAAFVRLDTIQENDVNFVTRQQMEGQSVFAIDQNFFKWRLLDPLPPIEDLELDL
jgi:hypothetical protein